MIQHLERLLSNVNICGVEISLNGMVIPSDITGWQPFHNSTFSGADFGKVFAAISSITFNEESGESPAGTIYKKRVTFRINNSDKFRSERIEIFSKVSFIKLKLTSGLDLIIGRNDWNQNAKPKFKYKSNQVTSEFEYENISITPCGFTPSTNHYGLPTLIPITLN